MPDDFLRRAFRPFALRKVADPSAYLRGSGEAGEVTGLTRRGGRIEGTVRGAEVALWLEAGRPTWRCSCDAEGGACQHVVAVALAAQDADLPELEPAPRPPDLRGRLHAMDHDALVELVVELAERDPELARRLED